MKAIVAIAVIAATVSTSAFAGVTHKRSEIIAAYNKCPILGDLESGPDYLAYRDTLDACIWDMQHPVAKHHG